MPTIRCAAPSTSYVGTMRTRTTSPPLSIVGARARERRPPATPTSRQPPRLRRRLVQPLPPLPPLRQCSPLLGNLAWAIPVQIPLRADHTDPESARDALSAAVSLVLRLVGRDPDPAKSREHVLLSVLAERRLAAGQPAELGALLEDLASPPIDRVGALKIDSFVPKKERQALAAALNTLLASPMLASWR